MDRWYETQGEGEICRAVWWENLKEEDRMEDQIVDKGLTLKMVNFIFNIPCIMDQFIKK
jgi:hypothetical protein